MKTSFDSPEFPDLLWTRNFTKGKSGWAKADCVFKWDMPVMEMMRYLRGREILRLKNCVPWSELVGYQFKLLEGCLSCINLIHNIKNHENTTYSILVQAFIHFYMFPL
jgi:hypothetical protein